MTHVCHYSEFIFLIRNEIRLLIHYGVFSYLLFRFFIVTDLKDRFLCFMRQQNLIYKGLYLLIQKLLLQAIIEFPKDLWRFSVMLSFKWNQFFLGFTILPIISTRNYCSCSYNCQLQVPYYFGSVTRFKYCFNFEFVFC